LQLEKLSWTSKETKMALETTLSKIEAYNALISIPQTGLLGIGAFRVRPASAKPVETLLERCSQICELAEQSISGTEDAKRQNVHLFSALRQVFPKEEDQQELRATLSQTRKACEAMLRQLRGESSELSPEINLEQLTAQLRRLADQIKQAIPRDTYLASLTGKTHPILGSLR
jgi:site-specific recombinase